METVLITGASKGIGKATAIRFAREGYAVAINYNNSKEQALSLEQSLIKDGMTAKAFKADVGNTSEVKQMFDDVKNYFGAPKILINNAGISQQKLFCDITDDDWNKMINVNLTGVFNCCKQAVPSMISNHAGKIINVSSIWGVTGGSCEVHYSAAKAGVIGLTKALAKELAPSGITVNCVAPGAIETDMNNEISQEGMEMFAEETPLGRIGRPEEIAECILFMASEKANFVTGHVFNINGGYFI